METFAKKKNGAVNAVLPREEMAAPKKQTTDLEKSDKKLSGVKRNNKPNYLLRLL